MPKQVHPRGPEWERGRQAGYYAGQKSNLEYLRECRKENKRLRAALRFCDGYLRGEPSPNYQVLDTISAALAGGGES